MEKIHIGLFEKGETLATIVGPIKFSIVGDYYRVNYINDGEIYDTKSLERAIQDVKAHLKLRR
jgi:hypothetical protein